MVQFVPRILVRERYIYKPILSENLQAVTMYLLDLKFVSNVSIPPNFYNCVQIMNLSQ